MKKNFRLLVALYMIFVTSCASCTKSDVEAEVTVINPPVETEIIESFTLPVDSVPSDATIYHIGAGSGNLTIDGKAINCDKNAFIKIKGGTYSTITVKNLLAAPGTRIFIKNDGEVKISEAMYTNNLNNVTISGNHVKGISHGIKFENIPYRALIMEGKINGVTLRNMSFKNVANYSINGEKSNGFEFHHRGTPETRTENLKILNCSFDNAGSIIFGGTLNKESGEDSGFFRNVEIAYNSFKNSKEVGSVCYFSNVQNYDIHHNIVDNINHANNNHNGIFWMQGNGKFHHNRLTNYQGNAIRAWLYSRGQIPSTIEIYQNICFNTRKYGAFELQSFDRHLIKGTSTVANAKIYNNTVGQMNTSHDWEGQILDLYQTGGTLEYYNNLGFNLVAVNKPLSNMINNMSDTKITIDRNNKYALESGDAVNNLVEFKSNYPLIGATPGK